MTIRLPKDLLSDERCKAADERRDLTSLIEHVLRAILSEGLKRTKRKRVAAGTSKTTGGLMPGVDLTNPRALQEVDDLGYLCRMQRSQ